MSEIQYVVEAMKRWGISTEKEELVARMKKALEITTEKELEEKLGIEGIEGVLVEEGILDMNSVDDYGDSVLNFSIPVEYEGEKGKRIGSWYTVDENTVEKANINAKMRKRYLLEPRQIKKIKFDGVQSFVSGETGEMKTKHLYIFDRFIQYTLPDEKVRLATEAEISEEKMKRLFKQKNESATKAK